MANFSFFLSLLFIFNYLSQRTLASNHTKHNGLSFRMIHRYEPDSPLYQPNLTVQETAWKLIRLSEARLESSLEHDYLKRDNNNSEAINQVIRPPLTFKFGQSSFLVQVGLGTFRGTPPFMTYYLQLDTGSGDIWTQCEGCNPCFNQRDPVFPRSRSRTYRALPCNQCPEGTTCQQDHCRVQLEYMDGTLVQGIAAKETFAFASTASGSVMTMQNLRFTCVIRSQNFVPGLDPDNFASGIFGMNRRPASFMSQVGAQMGGRFSYCLQPPDYQGRRPPMFLRFGDDIPHLHYLHRGHTPILQSRNPNYYLDLRAISVGSNRLNINPQLFQLRRDGSGGCMIDSGAGATHIITQAYWEFEGALRQNIEANNPGITMTSRTPQLCYRQPRPRQRTTFPTVTFHFANDANLVVQPEAYMVGFRHPKPQDYCLLIRPLDLKTVFGAPVQVNHRFIFDTRNSELHFAPENCLSSN